MSESTAPTGAGRHTIRVALPFHLRNLAGVGPEISLEVAAPITIARVLDALENAYPMLRGTIREYETGKRRAFLRFFACQEDLSHEGMDAALPAEVVQGSEPLLIIGAIAGG
jgi:molybdopterin synthase sulfur carrier subunit